MITPGQTLENPVTGERFTFTDTAATTAGELLAFDFGLRPGGAVPIPHVHPVQTERFEVIEGQMRFRVGLRTVVAGPGDVVEVEPGVAHSFANAGDERGTAAGRGPPGACDGGDVRRRRSRWPGPAAWAARGMPRNLLDLGAARAHLRPGGPRAAARAPSPAHPARAAGVAGAAPRRPLARSLLSRPDANMCSCQSEAHDPARRPRLVLRVGRAARRSRPARPPGDRRAAGSCSPPATRPRPSACARRWAGARRAGCARTAIVVPPRIDGLLRGQQGGLRGLRRHDAAGRGRCRSTRRSSTSRGLRRISGSPVEIAARLRARGARRRSGCRSPSASRGPSSSPRSPAAVAKPDGLLVVPPDARARVPAPAAGRAALGRRPRSPPRKLHARGHHHGRPGRRARARRRWSRCSAGRRAATSTRSRTTATRGRVRVGRRRRSIGSQRALGRRRAARREELDATLVGARRPAWPAHARGAPRRAAR